MKDVSEILSKRLAKLNVPFSREWVADFRMLMEYINSNSATNQIVAAIQEKKEQAHADLLCHLSSLFKDGATCLRQIKSHIPSNEVELSAQVKLLLETSIDAHKITDPFFEFETLYCDYHKGFLALMKGLIQHGSSDFISKYCSFNRIELEGIEHVSIDLTFSQFLQLYQQDIEVLSGEKESSIWGKWDMLLQWEEWTKNGISPANDIYERNLSDLFRGQK